MSYCGLRTQKSLPSCQDLSSLGTGNLTRDGEENEEMTDTRMPLQKSWGQVGGLHLDEVASNIKQPKPCAHLLFTTTMGRR